MTSSCGFRQALLHRAATGRPFSVLKYAMTADGKIATASGHSAWVSSPASRQLVFETRARSDAVIVGGNTARAGPHLDFKSCGVDEREAHFTSDHDCWFVIFMYQVLATCGLSCRCWQ